MLSDQEMSQSINSFMATNKFVTRRQLRDKFKTSDYRLGLLAKVGLIVLPKAMSASAAAKLGRAKSKYASKNERERANA